MKYFLYMDTYKFDSENQAMFCLVDIKVIIKTFNLWKQKSNLQKKLKLRNLFKRSFKKFNI